MKNDRLFQILYILLEKGPVTAPELARLLEVSVRTIYRDVEALSISGVPVYTSPGKGGGISLLAGYTFDRALLSDEEQNQLLFAIQSLRAADQQVGGLLQKLGSVFQKQSANWIEVNFSRWGLGQVDNRKFELLKTAILGKRLLHIDYCGVSGAITKRDIKPFKLIFKDKSWYLQAYCTRAEDFRLFKVSRIMELSLSPERFTEEFLDAPPVDGEAPPAIAAKLKLQFASGLAFRVYDEFDRSGICEQPDGSLVVSVSLPLDGWVLNYLLSFGTGVTVLEPPHLRTALAAYAEQIFEHHRVESK